MPSAFEPRLIQCKRCDTKVNLSDAADSNRRIAAVCEGLEMPRSRVNGVVAQQGPLCPKCLGAWGSGENDLAG
jgi:hypothetical protein